MALIPREKYYLVTIDSTGEKEHTAAECFDVRLSEFISL